MILRSIKVEGWRCFADAKFVGPFGEGLNVVHGRNGSGKSTLLWALTRCLFDSHKVGGTDVQSLRPWGRELNPHVVVEFSHEGQEYRLEKRFLGSPMAELCQLEDGRFVRLAESVAADKRARQMLSGDTPGRGVTDERHWGFAQVLWATQGALRIGTLSDGTKSTIQEALGAQVAGPVAGKIEERIYGEYSAIFTRTGKFKSGAAAPRAVDLQRQLDEAQKRRAACRKKLQEFEAASRRIEDLRSQTRDARQQEQALLADLKTARKQARIYEQLSARRQTQMQKADNARANFNNLHQRIDSIKKTRDQLAKVEEELTRLRQDAPARLKMIRQCSSEAAAARDELQTVRAKRPSVSAARCKADLAAKLIAAQRTQAETERLIGRIERIEVDLNRLGSEREKLVAPDSSAIRKIKSAVADRDRLQNLLDASLIRVEIISETATTIELEHGDETGIRDLAPGQAAEFKGASEVALRIHGVGTFRATGPAGSADRHREQLEQLHRQIRSLTDGYGTRDVEQLESLHQQAAELVREIKALGQQLQTLLGDRPRQEIGEQKSRAAKIAEEIFLEFPVWTTSLPEPDELVSEAEDLQNDFTEEIDAAEARRDKAEEALRLAERDEQSWNADLHVSQQRKIDMESRLSDLCGEEDDATREEALQSLALVHEGAKAQLAQFQQELEQFSEDPSSDVEIFENQCDALRESVAACNDKLKTEEGHLQSITSEAPYSALIGEEETIRQLEEELARENRHNNAVRLIYETITQCKREVVDSLVRPVRRRAQQTLRRIAGDHFKGIEFDASFLPKGVEPSSHGESVAIDYISGGEQEQVHFAVRLALADVAFQSQRQLIVLDDPFTATDSAGLARIVTILHEAAERFQIILLSCHPERYSHMSDAVFFDLEALSTDDTQRDPTSAPHFRLRHAQAGPET